MRIKVIMANGQTIESRIAKNLRSLQKQYEASKDSFATPQDAQQWLLDAATRSVQNLANRAVAIIV